MIQKMLPTHFLKFAVKVIKSMALKMHFIAKRLNAISVLGSAEKKILQRNAQFKEKHKGERAFVIVNGSSLKQQDISWLGNEITFTVSGFFRHEVIKKWQPRYHSIIDKGYFDGSVASKLFFDQVNAALKTCTFFIPLYAGLRANEKYQLLPAERTFYFATAGLPSLNNDMTGVVQSCPSVSSFALAQAIYMGCNPIYLLGFDHDYLANRGVDKHFYEGHTRPGAAVEMIPLGERIPYDTEMTALLNLWRSYRSLARIAKKKGIKIYNATRGGYLDVFERVDFEKIVADQK